MGVHASEEAVALEEGMPGAETDVLRRVLLALGSLTGPLDIECTGPTKQHGLHSMKAQDFNTSIASASVEVIRNANSTVRVSRTPLRAWRGRSLPAR